MTSIKQLGFSEEVEKLVLNLNDNQDDIAISNVQPTTSSSNISEQEALIKQEAILAAKRESVLDALVPPPNPKKQQQLLEFLNQKSSDKETVSYLKESLIKKGCKALSTNDEELMTQTLACTNIEDQVALIDECKKIELEKVKESNSGVDEGIEKFAQQMKENCVATKAKGLLETLQQGSTYDSKSTSRVTASNQKKIKSKDS